MSVNELLGTTTNRLVAINLAVFVLMQALFAGSFSGLELYFWENQQFRLWQIVTYMFLHGGLTHLLLNMIALWSFGRILEDVWGARRLLIFFLVCGVGAALVHLAVSYYQFHAIYQDLLAAGLSQAQIESVYYSGRVVGSSTAQVPRELLVDFYHLYNAPAVGASGAVYGILVAFTLLFPNFKVMLIFLPVPVAAKYFVPVLLIIDLVAGLTGNSIFGFNIAHFAHLGGALAGFLMVQYWLRSSR